MVKVTLNSGATLGAFWVMKIRGGSGGVMLEVAEAPFSALAATLEGASALRWDDPDSSAQQATYTQIRHITRGYGRVQIILEVGA